MKHIFTFLIFSTFFFSAKANSLSPDSTVCPNLNAVNIFVNGNTAKIFGRVENNQNSANYEIQFKIDSTKFAWQNAIVLNSDSIITELTGLTSCRQYVMRIRVKCSDGIFSDWKVLNFVIYGCAVECKPVTDVQFQIMDSVSTATNSNVMVTAKLQGRSFFVEYKTDDNAITWEKVVSSDSYSAFLENLKQCKNYSARIISACYLMPTLFDTTPTYHFKTTCFDKISCAPLEKTENNLFIYNLKAGEVAHYEVQYKLATENLWIGDDTITLYGASNNRNFLPLNSTFKNLKLCKIYNARVRTLCNSNSNWITFDFNSGGCEPLCQKIDSVSFIFSDSLRQNDTTYRAQINWLHISHTDYIEYRVQNTSQWFQSKNNYVENITPCTSYDVRIISLCTDAHNELISNTSKIFTMTVPCKFICKKIEGLSFNATSDSTASGKWNETGTHDFYSIDYKTDAEVNWHNSFSFVATAQLSKLIGCQTYTVRVISSCHGVYDTAFTKFSTNKKGSGNCFKMPGGLNKFSDVNKLAFITLSPNPSNSEPNVMFQLTAAANVTIKVFDALGSNVLNNYLGNLEASEHSQTLSGAENLPAGFYFVIVQSNNETPLMVRFVKL